MTATHLKWAALLLETQIAVGDPSNDLPEHAEARQMACKAIRFQRGRCPIYRRRRSRPAHTGRLQEHPAARCAFRFLRLTRDEARRLAHLPGLHIYTDGSYTDRLAGAAFIVLGPSERIGAVGRYQVENATSAYCTEVIAFDRGVEIRQKQVLSCHGQTITDCLSLVQTISEYKTTDPRVRDVKALLNDISATTEITLHHVPGHSGLFGNELADFLAARAARLGDARQAPLTPRAVRSMLRREQLRRWESDWGAKHCRHGPL
ncbi:hypothetical protein MRX96_020741 [Rhipicephalus microplus]